MVATTTDLQPGPRHGSGSQTPGNDVSSSPPPLAPPIDPSHYTRPGHTLVAAEDPTSSDFCKARTQTETFQHSVISAISGLRPYEAKGWDAVERALDEFDKQEVGAYKEDIDTLLVFAGLYSAVLTAFVIESYPLLQEDTASESLQVLRFIANQTSNSASSMGFPSSPSFTPNPAAIRVNVLWFASLVLSLSTASLAIFVKQWLREYMAFSTSSAQGKLRVREFRRAGLEVWRVFGIASILPLLLQLSLLLFFVGLCYFTGNIHPSVANATLPLVCAWGFLITCVTTASIFSARCPYTTPGLRPLTTFIRVYIYSPLAAVVVWRYRLITTSLVDTVNSRFHDPEAVSRVILTSVYIAYAIITLPYHIIMFLLLFMIPIQDGSSYAELIFERPLEEADIVRDESKDLDILVKADNLQANDELLGTTMKAALEQSKPTWDRAVEFLLDVIRNRMPLSATARISDKPYPLDLHPLPAGARQAVANMFTSHVMDPDSLRSIRRMSTSSNEEVQNAISWVACLATSLYRDYALSDIPQTHSRFLLEHIVRTEKISDHFFLQGPDYHRTESMNWVLSLAYQVCRDTDDMTLLQDLATLVSLMLKLKQARSEFGVLSDVASDISLGLSKTDGPTLHEIFEQSYRLLSDPSLRDVVSTSRGLTSTLCDIIMMFTNTPSEVRASPWLFDHFSRLGYALCTVPLQNLDPLSSFLAACIQSDSNYNVESLRQPTSMIWSLASINFDETVTSHLESAIMALPHMIPGLGTSEILVLCSMMSIAASNAAGVLTEGQPDQSDAKDIVGRLRRIFDLLGPLLWKLDVLDRGLTSAEEFLIGSCWEPVQAIEAAQAHRANRDNGHSGLDYERWAQGFEEATAAVGDDFCLALIRLLIDHAVFRNHSYTNYVNLSHSVNWRPRRLKALVDMGAYATIARAEKQRREVSRPNQRGDGVKPRRKDPFEVISIITDSDD